MPKKRIVLPVVSNDDPDKEGEPDHGAEEDVEVDVDGVGWTHLQNKH